MRHIIELASSVWSREVQHNRPGTTVANFAQTVCLADWNTPIHPMDRYGRIFDRGSRYLNNLRQFTASLHSEQWYLHAYWKSTTLYDFVAVKSRIPLAIDRQVATYLSYRCYSVHNRVTIHGILEHTDKSRATPLSEILSEDTVLHLLPCHVFLHRELVGLQLVTTFHWMALPHSRYLLPEYTLNSCSDFLYYPRHSDKE